MKEKIWKEIGEDREVDDKPSDSEYKHIFCLCLLLEIWLSPFQKGSKQIPWLVNSITNRVLDACECRNL
jgi:hypothetical protein